MISASLSPIGSSQSESSNISSIIFSNINTNFTKTTVVDNDGDQPGFNLNDILKLNTKCHQLQECNAKLQTELRECKQTYKAVVIEQQKNIQRNDEKLFYMRHQISTNADGIEQALNELHHRFSDFTIYETKYNEYQSMMKHELTIKQFLQVL